MEISYEELIAVQNSSQYDEPSLEDWNKDVEVVNEKDKKKAPPPAKGKVVEEEVVAPPKEEVKATDFDIIKNNPRLSGVKDEENTLMRDALTKIQKGPSIYNLHNLKNKTDEDAYVFISKSQLFIL